MKKIKDNGTVRIGERFRLKKAVLVTDKHSVKKDNLVTVIAIFKESFKVQDNFKGFRWIIKNKEKASALSES